MNKAMIDSLSRTILQYTICKILENVSTGSETPRDQNFVITNINRGYPHLFAFQPNTPLGIVKNRFKVETSNMDKDYFTMDDVENFLKQDPTADSLLANAIYTFSSGYSIQLNELRHIIPEDVDKTMTHVRDVVLKDKSERRGNIPCEFFSWGHLEEPSYQDMLKTFLYNNVNILKSPGSKLSDSHNFTAIMRRLGSKDNFAKTILPLTGHGHTSCKFLRLVDEVKAHAPLIKELMNSSYQDDMTDTLVQNINVMNHVYMLMEGLVLYHMHVTFKNAVVLPGEENHITINTPVFHAHFITDEDPGAGQDEISNVMYYISKNTVPTSPHATGINRWVPHRGGISYFRVKELCKKATAYCESESNAYLAEERQREISKIQETISSYLDRWFAEFKKTYDISDNVAYGKLHNVHKQICLRRIKETDDDPENLIVSHLMDYFVAVRNSSLLTALYRSTFDYYTKYINKDRDNVDQENTDIEKDNAQINAVIKTFLDFFMPKYTVPLPKNA